MSEQRLIICAEVLPGTLRQEETTQTLLVDPTQPAPPVILPPVVTPPVVTPPVVTPPVVTPPANTSGLALFMPEVRIGGHWDLPTYTAIYPEKVVPIGAAPLTASHGMVSNQVVSVVAAGKYKGRSQVAFSAAIAGLGCMDVTDTATGLCGRLYDTFGAAGENHPLTIKEYSYFTVNATTPGRFYQGDALPYLSIDNIGGAITDWVCCDFYGNTVATGTVTGTDFDTRVELPQLTGKCGFYFIWFTGGPKLPGIGNCIASTVFTVAPADDPATNLRPASASVRAFASFGGYDRISEHNAASPNIAALSDTARYAQSDYVLGLDGEGTDPAQPKSLFFNFPDIEWYRPMTAEEIAGVTQTVATLYPLGVHYFAARNEPNGNPDARYLPVMQQFRAAVKAGHPDAQVAGFEAVNASSPGLEDLLAAGGGDTIDARTFHAYDLGNSFEAGQRSLAAADAMWARHGQQNKPLFMTEQGAIMGQGGVTLPFVCASQFWTQMLLFDRNGLDPAHTLYWYTYVSDLNFEDWVVNADGSYNPQVIWFRHAATERWSMTFSHTLDFGNGGNTLWVANVFTGQGAREGHSVVMLYGKDYRGDALTIAVSQGSAEGPNVPATLTGADAWGNETVFPVVDGTITLPPGDGLAYYLRIPTGLVLSPRTDYGPDIALGKAVTTLTNKTQAQCLTDGTGETLWSSDNAWFDQAGAGSDLIDRWLAGNTKYPYYLTVDLGVGADGLPPLVSRFIIASVANFQSACGIISANVYTQDVLNGPLTPQGGIRQPPHGLEILSNLGTLATFYADWFARQTRFSVLFSSPKRARYVVLEITETTPGGAGNLISAGFGGQPSKDYFGRNTPTAVTFNRLQVFSQ